MHHFLKSFLREGEENGESNEDIKIKKIFSGEGLLNYQSCA